MNVSSPEGEVSPKPVKSGLAFLICLCSGVSALATRMALPLGRAVRSNVFCTVQSDPPGSQLEKSDACCGHFEGERNQGCHYQVGCQCRACRATSSDGTHWRTGGERDGCNSRRDHFGAR